MARQIRNQTCYECELTRPVDHMKRVTINVKTGHSGGSFSGRPLAGSSQSVRKSVRVYSGRSYYKTKQVWQCKDFWAHGSEDYYVKREQRSEEQRLASEERRKHADHEKSIKNTINTLQKRVQEFDFSSNVSEPEFSKIKNLFYDKCQNEIEKIDSNKKAKSDGIKCLDARKNDLGKPDYYLREKYGIHSLIVSQMLRGPVLRPLRALAIVTSILSPIFFILSFVAAMTAAAIGVQNDVFSAIGAITILTFGASLIVLILSAAVPKRLKSDVITELTEVLKGVEVEIYNNIVELYQPSTEALIKDLFETYEDWAGFEKGIEELCVKFPPLAPLIKKHTVKLTALKVFSSENALDKITWVLAKHVMTADHEVSDEEIQWLSRNIELSDSDLNDAEVLHEHENSVNISASIFRKLFPKHPKLRLLLIQNLLTLAAADSTISENEEKMISSISELIGMKPADFVEALSYAQKSLNSKKQEFDADGGSSDSSTLGELDDLDELFT